MGLLSSENGLANSTAVPLSKTRTTWATVRPSVMGVPMASRASDVKAAPDIDTSMSLTAEHRDPYALIATAFAAAEVGVGQRGQDHRASTFHEDRMGLSRS